MSGDEKPDGTIDAGEFLNHRCVFDVAEAGATVVFRKNDAHQAHLAQLGENFSRKMRGFVPLHDVRSDLVLGKFADGLAELLLFLGEREIQEFLVE